MALFLFLIFICCISLSHILRVNTWQTWICRSQKCLCHTGQQTQLKGKIDLSDMVPLNAEFALYYTGGLKGRKVDKPKWDCRDSKPNHLQMILSLSLTSSKSEANFYEIWDWLGLSSKLWWLATLIQVLMFLDKQIILHKLFVK
jgi:hypothetical protein